MFEGLPCHFSLALADVFGKPPAHFKATTLRAGAMFVMGAPLMPLPPSFGISDSGTRVVHLLCASY